MKQLLLMIAVVIGQSVLAADKKFKVFHKLLKSSPKLEAAIRQPWASNKPTGKFTKADLEKVMVLVLDKNRLTDISALVGLTQLRRLQLSYNQLTDVSALAKLTQLKWLSLKDNPDLTKAKIAKLQKALPKCKISHNATK